MKKSRRIKVRKIQDNIYLTDNNINKNKLELISDVFDGEITNVFQAILDAIPYVIIGAHNRQIVFVNKSVESVFGWKPDEVIGKNVRILFSSDEEYKKVGKKLYTGLRTKKNYQEEYTYKRKDEKNIICMINASKIGKSLKEKSIVAMLQDITEKKINEENLKQTLLKYEKTTESLIHLPGNLLAMRDPYTAGHEEKVAKIAKGIAENMGLPKEKIEAIYISGLLHDTGKIFIPMEILAKPSKLEEDEWNLIKKHPTYAYKIFKNIYLPWNIMDSIIHHHERLNGSGYPDGIKGKNISIEAKIIAVADVVEAMSSFRPYRPALGIEKAIEEISMNKGKLYDPYIVEACIKYVSNLDKKFFENKFIAFSSEDK